MPLKRSVSLIRAISLKQIKLFIVGTILLASCGLWAQAAPASQILTKRFVEIEFETTEGAVSYELEIYNNVTKKFIKSFVSKTSMFKLNVKMGKYLIRSRITDNFQRTSPWSELTEMLIAPPPTKIISKAPGLGEPIFADKKTNSYLTTLKWQALSGVDSYLVVAETPEGEKLSEYKADKSELKMELAPGAYKFKIMAILADGTIGDASALSEVYNILGAKILPPRLAFKKHETGNEYVQVNSELKNAVLEGVLEYQPLESLNWVVAQKIENTEIKNIELAKTLAPGKYKLSLKAVAKGYSTSEVTMLEFIIKPKLPDILSIENEVALALEGKDSVDLQSKNVDETKKKE